MNSKVCILAAGNGTRMGHYSKVINKALLPINKKAVISHIIEKFLRFFGELLTFSVQLELAFELLHHIKFVDKVPSREGVGQKVIAKGVEK